jgi:hypothetical protein
MLKSLVGRWATDSPEREGLHVAHPFLDDDEEFPGGCLSPKEE